MKKIIRLCLLILTFPLFSLGQKEINLSELSSDEKSSLFPAGSDGCGAMIHSYCSNVMYGESTTSFNTDSPIHIQNVFMKINGNITNFVYSHESCYVHLSFGYPQFINLKINYCDSKPDLIKINNELIQYLEFLIKEYEIYPEAKKSKIKEKRLREHAISRYFMDEYDGEVEKKSDAEVNKEINEYIKKARKRKSELNIDYEIISDISNGSLTELNDLNEITSLIKSIKNKNIEEIKSIYSVREYKEVIVFENDYYNLKLEINLFENSGDPILEGIKEYGIAKLFLDKKFWGKILLEYAFGC